jgi:hypothetical protein
MHLAAEQLIVLGNLLVDGKTIRIPQRLPDLRRILVRQFLHTHFVESN